MTCFHPISATYDRAAGAVFFSGRDLGRGDPIQLPCGRCVGCRLERSRQWAVRCMHEASMHTDNSFITLTYDDAHLPSNGSLNYVDWQKFAKRLRRRGVDFRFYMCGEYGDRTNRPHYHACIFGYSFPDRKLFRRTNAGSLIYRSDLLESVWPLGISSVGDLTFESAAYVSRYVMKKITGDLAKEHYKRVDVDTGEVFHVEPEFCHMSLKPGIGAAWFDKYKSDVYPHDHVVINGKEAKPPRYYDKLLKRTDCYDFDDVKQQRIVDAIESWEDNTDQRLRDKETFLASRAGRYRRSLD